MAIKIDNNRIIRCRGDSWHVNGMGVNLHPRKKDLVKPNAEYEYVLKNWVPQNPFIDKNTSITSFGSCFAHNICNYLAARKYNINNTSNLAAVPYIVEDTDALVNTYSILQQFEWASGRNFSEYLWYDAKGWLSDHNNNIVRKATTELLSRSEVFIITLGLSEVWMNEQTGEVFWRGIPEKNFDSTKHAFKIVSPDENETNILQIIEKIKSINKDSKIIFTLSPVPLRGTFRDTPSITSDCVSKASLRIAIDNIMRSNKDNVYYFPSYELIKYMAIDQYGDDNIHVKPDIIDNMMKIFCQYFVK